MKRKIMISVIGMVAIALIALLAGNSAISTSDIVAVLTGNGSESNKVILYQVRMPRILAAAACGAALSVSGFLLQGSLDNRIASPGILGINNGAGLFVLLSALFFPFQIGVKCIMAFAGAFVVTVFVSILSAKTGMSKTSVILSGVAISAVCVSLIDVIISLKPETVADRAAFQIGGFSSVSYRGIVFAVPLVIIGLAVALWTVPGLDILSLGDETAQGLGLNVHRYRYICILCAALLAGASICMGGLLSFVGLIVPNCVRMLHVGNSKSACILCMTVGASFMLVCDTLARLLVFPYELPCGLLLSLIGAPFLVWILVKKRKRLGAD